MTVPTNITEPPMGHTEQESHLKSRGKKLFISMDLIHHVFQTFMGLFNDDQLEKLSHWIQYKGYESLTTCMMIFTITQRMSKSLKILNGMVSRITLVPTLYRKSKASPNG